MAETGFPRLAFSNSSPVRATPRSLAKAKSLRCHFPGTPPNQDQLPTVDALMPNAPASFFGPPNRDTISDTSDIPDTISRFWMFVNPEFGHLDSGCAGGLHVDNAGMSGAAKKKPADAKRQPKDLRLIAAEKLLRRQMGQRLREARKEAGHKLAKSFAELIDIEPGKYGKYERGEMKIPHTAIVAIAQQHISIHFLFLGIGPKTVPEAFRYAG